MLWKFQIWDLCKYYLRKDTSIQSWNGLKQSYLDLELVKKGSERGTRLSCLELEVEDSFANILWQHEASCGGQQWYKQDYLQHYSYANKKAVDNIFSAQKELSVNDIIGAAEKNHPFVPKMLFREKGTPCEKTKSTNLTCSDCLCTNNFTKALLWNLNRNRVWASKVSAPYYKIHQCWEKITRSKIGR